MDDTFIDLEGWSQYVYPHKVPPTLIERWRERGGNDLHYSFIAWGKYLKAKKRLTSLRHFEWMYEGFAFIGIAAVIYAMYHHNRPLAIVGALMIIFSAYQAGRTVHLQKRERSSMDNHRTAVEWKFFSQFAAFVSWSRNFPNIMQASRTELELCATTIVLDAAREVILMERQLPKPKNPLEEEHLTISLLRKAFGVKYNSLKNLGLITQPNGYKWFYDRALRHIEASGDEHYTIH